MLGSESKNGAEGEFELSSLNLTLFRAPPSLSLFFLILLYLLILLNMRIIPTLLVLLSSTFGAPQVGSGGVLSQLKQLTHKIIQRQKLVSMRDDLLKIRGDVKRNGGYLSESQMSRLRRIENDFSLLKIQTSVEEK